MGRVRPCLAHLFGQNSAAPLLDFLCAVGLGCCVGLFRPRGCCVWRFGDGEIDCEVGLFIVVEEAKCDVTRALDGVLRGEQVVKSIDFVLA